MNVEKTKLEKLLDELKEQVASLERELRIEKDRASYWHDKWEGLCNPWKPCAYTGKPQRKRRISIKLDSRGDTLGLRSGKIFFYSSYSLAESLKEFGRVTDEGGYHVLTVDGRYDYDEVLAYIKSL